MTFSTRRNAAPFVAQVIGQALLERATLPPLSHNWQYMRLIARQLYLERARNATA